MADPSPSTPSGSSSSIDPPQSESPFRQTTRRSPPSAFGSPASTMGSAPTPVSRMPLRTNPVSTTFTPTKRVIIRADQTLVSCFDPADKELYDLWAPKQ